MRDTQIVNLVISVVKNGNTYIVSTDNLRLAESNSGDIEYADRVWKQIDGMTSEADNFEDALGAYGNFLDELDFGRMLKDIE